MEKGGNWGSRVWRWLYRYGYGGNPEGLEKHPARKGLFKRRGQKQAYQKIVKDSGHKLVYLESIRGIAACIVVIGHVIGAVYPAEVSGPTYGPIRSELLHQLLYGLPLGFSVAGHFAVVVFFVLSGYVLTYKYFATKDTTVLYGQAAKRYLRLAVPVFFSVMLGYGFMKLGLMHNAELAAVVGSKDGASVFNFTPNFLDALYNATIGVFAGGTVKYDPVLWTMPIELIGSFVIFGLAPLFARLRYRWAAYLLSMIILNISYFTCFILGMMLADLVASTNFIQRIRRGGWPVVSYLLVVVVWVLASMPYPSPDSAGTLYHFLYVPGIDMGIQFRIWQFVGGTLLLAIILGRKEIQKILSIKPLVYIGGISFSIYLTHFFVVNSIGAKVFLVLHDKIGYTKSAVLMAIVVVAVAIPVALVWNKYIDKTAIAWSRRFAAFILAKPSHERDQTHSDNKQVL